MNVLVTGGAGFIGSHVSEALLKRGDKVICVDNFDDFYDVKVKLGNIKNVVGTKGFTLMKMDIREKNSVEKLFTENNIDSIIHLAARAGVRPSIEQPEVYIDVNVNGTINLLEACKKKKIKNFIFGSSSSVYGISSKVPFSEKDPISFPISPYAVSKRAAELMCFTYHHLYQLPVTCLRFFTVYGPRQRPDLAIHKFTKLISEGKEIPMFGDGSTRRDYTYVDDVVDGVLSALDNIFEFEIINLGNQNPISLNGLVTLIEANLGKKARIKCLPEQPGDVPITYADISKAKKLLGYSPRTRIKIGIKKFVEWFQDSY